MRDLIVFGEDFGGLPSSTQHLISNLNKERKVLWVNSIGLRKPRLCVNDAKRVVDKALGKGKQDFVDSSAKVATPDNIKVVNLRTIPAPKHAWERQLAKTMMLTQLKPLLEKYRIENPILWSSLPTAADLCGSLNETAVVYYCGDDFNSLAGVDHDTVSEHETHMAQQASIILAASQNISGKFPQTKTHVLRHGVDYNRFTTPAERATDLPQGKPIAGFYGSLSEWLDYDMINAAAKALPGWNFVFIGKNELRYNPLADLPNIHVLGPKPHYELPKYSQHWDVSLLTFKDNEQIRACSPLKLLEYIAAGKPVINTPFPAAKTYENQLNQVNDTDEFITALRQYPRLIQTRPGSVESESWASRALFVDWLLELL
ncbi:glycosyltransferase [Vibrio agarivorans]|uniref:Glycosyltransferase n=1 Tax=Vibrio agarivorans TaxID=153622 RepID=A0ABT7XYL7_9VIBR|nr:glycosyltransferase [Vibrio agarivorans]MDN2480877.1 glycosyltransferase [Vibrio agarivorans]